MPNPLNIICAWNRLPTANEYVGELIISGNSIDFLCRDLGHNMPAIYIGLLFPNFPTGLQINMQSNFAKQRTVAPPLARSIPQRCCFTKKLL